MTLRGELAEFTEPLDGNRFRSIGYRRRSRPDAEEIDCPHCGKIVPRGDAWVAGRFRGRAGLSARAGDAVSVHSNDPGLKQIDLAAPIHLSLDEPEFADLVFGLSELPVNFCAVVCVLLSGSDFDREKGRVEGQPGQRWLTKCASKPDFDENPALNFDGNYHPEHWSAARLLTFQAGHFCGRTWPLRVLARRAEQMS